LFTEAFKFPARFAAQVPPVTERYPLPWERDEIRFLESPMIDSDTSIEYPSLGLQIGKTTQAVVL
jgi:hypothetical protein